MEIAIKVPDDFYERVNKDGCMSYTDAEVVVNAFYRGKVLPKGHGALKDTDALKTAYGLEGATKYGNESKEQLENSYSTMMLYEIADMLDYAPTIIEADKEGNGDADSN